MFWMAHEAWRTRGPRRAVGRALAHGGDDEAILAAIEGRKKPFANRIRESKNMKNKIITIFYPNHFFFSVESKFLYREASG